MKLKFFTYVTNETANWNSLPPNAKASYGLYVICHNEATHNCSLSADSWAVFLQNVFINKDNEAEQLHEFLDSNFEWGFEGDSCYFSYIDHAKNKEQCSTLYEFEGDTREECWESAVDYFSCNQKLPKNILSA